MNADQWGVSFGYVDTEDVQHVASSAVRAKIRDALGAPEDPSIGPADDGAIVVNVDDNWTLHTPAQIVTEHGDEQRIEAGWKLPNDFPIGYHRIHIDDQPGERAFIVAPATCARPDSFHGWGWATQLYAMRSYKSWGIGDLGDLATLNRWSRDHGASYTLINPLHAPAPTPGQQPSPYFPSSRIWRNPLFIDISQVPGWIDVASEMSAVVERAHRLLEDRRIDRDAVRSLKLTALERLWTRWPKAATGERDVFVTWRVAQGIVLERWALYCALVERHGGDTREWPADLASAASPGVEEQSRVMHDRVAFHAWLQWLLERQLEHANDQLPVMTDLAIGVDRAGADAWMWPDAFCRTMSVGAPPDTFNTKGQNWGLPPFNPWALRRLGYDPFIRTVRAAFSGSGAVRMDHVMGLFRLWWIPQDHAPTDGCYVYLPFRDLTGILALESTRFNLTVVGEDLGTIEPYVSTELSQRRILSYKLVQFETAASTTLPVEAMTALTTHDLPTIAGTWTGTDVIDALLADTIPNVTGQAEVRISLGKKAASHGSKLALPLTTETAEDSLFAHLSRLDRKVLDTAVPLGSLASAAQALGINEVAIREQLATINETLAKTRSADVPALMTGLLHELAAAPSRLIAATLDDAIGVDERPNLPGTTNERPNWQIALPAPLEVLLEHPGVLETAALLTKPATHSMTHSTNEEAP
jgi:4-alpha-glucanotransferase